jgi:NADPH:quinone reductase-like Zn-dependent oxidoreductase
LSQNTALWLPRPGTAFQPGPAPYTAPGAGEVVVRVRAVAVNPVDAMPGFAYRVVLPWLTVQAADRGETVLVWGGSTSVGSNAIQLARRAGFRVVATASPRNFDYVRSLGSAAAVDYHGRDAVDRVIAAIGDSPLAGSLAIGSGSLLKTLTIAARLPGRRRVAAAQPALVTRIQLLGRRRHGVQVSAIWGGTLRDNAVGPGIYAGYLPAALARNLHQAAPPAVVVGTGLEQIPAAIDRIRRGVSAAKLVVKL